MMEFAVVAAVVALLIAMSLRADRRFRHLARLPMQWSLSGEVNWTAPRRIALALLPGLAIVILAPAAAMMLVTTPRPGQEGLEVPILLMMGAVLVAIHALHLWLIGRRC